jgi:hypothetical protein
LLLIIDADLAEERFAISCKHDYLIVVRGVLDKSTVWGR